jgi:glycolate oxidase iron-sulfur subunit
MQTSFPLARLADPDVAESERILRACVHCGFCTATCPTYVLLGDELDSPRGRIYLIKDMLEQDRPAAAEEVKHLDRCLTCLSCMTTCPSGVDYQHLLDHGRAHVAATFRRPWRERALRALLKMVMPHPERLRGALRLARAARPLGAVLARLGLPEIASLLALAPPQLPPRSTITAGMRFPALGTRRGRVALLSGCTNAALAPLINAAAVRLLTRHGVEVVVAKGEGCCGALAHHLGDEDAALTAARRNVDAWWRELKGEGLDAILITASGCGTAVKDYGHLLRGDVAYAGRAGELSALARDISEFLASLPLQIPSQPLGLVVAYHAACSLQHGQRVRAEPRALLQRVGFVVSEPADSHLCCGSAGTYNILQPELARPLRDRKIETIERLSPDIIASGNLGCMAQIASGTKVPVVHIVELIDWATGGPPPEPLGQRGAPPAAGSARRAPQP